MQQALRLAGLWSVDFYASQLRPLAQVNVEDHVGEHVGFIKLRLRSNLSLEVALRDKKLEKSPTSLGNDLRFIRRLVRNIDDLQQPCVSKSLRGPRELEDSEVECRLQYEGQMQPVGIRLDIQLHLAEPTRVFQCGDCAFHLRSGVRFAGPLLHQRAQRVD